ncbi:MAG: hypothetical protein ACKO96_05110 [Flammeovirgaceae bacterium]
MPIADLKYIAGTIKNPQHTKSTEAAFIDTNRVHFPDGRMTVIPAFIEALGVNISGICRSIYATVMNNSFVSAGHFFFGTHSHLYSLSRNVITNITPLKTTAEATLGTNPLSVTNTSNIITVTYTAHGLAIGDRIRLAGATTTGGIVNTLINAEHIVVTTPTANTFTIVVGVNASSTATGGGAAVQIFKQITAGNQYQEFLTGYGIGDYGEGDYGKSQTSTTNFQFPRIWSFDNFGRDVVMCAGDYNAGDGQKIYLWNGDTGVAPQTLLNAPTNCNWVFTLNNRVVALCENIIRISKRGDATVWTGNTTDALSVQKTGRLLSGVSFGDKASLVFAPDPYLLTDNGETVDLTELGVQYAIIAPQAFCRFNDGVLWYGSDHKIYFFNGTTVQDIINDQNGEFIRDTISLVDYWTCFMHADPKHNQAWFYFPDKTKKSPNNYVIFNPSSYAAGGAKPSFTLGMLERTAAQRSTFVENAFYLASETDVYASFVNEAIAFQWSATTAAVYVDGTYRYKINYVISDLVQSSNITLKVLGVAEPQKAAVDYGNFTLPAGAGKVGVRGAGKFFQFQFSGNGDMLLGGMKMYVEQQGERG